MRNLDRTDEISNRHYMPATFFNETIQLNYIIGTVIIHIKYLYFQKKKFGKPMLSTFEAIISANTKRV
jgi:hypothetical protein